METKAITTFAEFVQWLDFLVEGVVAIGVKNNENDRTADEVIEAMRRKLGSPDFNLLIQLNPEGVPLGFVAGVIANSFYDEKIGVLWLAYVKPGGKYGELVEQSRQWGRDKGVTKVEIVNVNLTPAKARWLRRFGLTQVQLQIWKGAV